MRSTFHWNRDRIAVAGVLLAVSTGCHEYPNVFIDALPNSDMVSTASMRRARETTPGIVPAEPPLREFETARVAAADGTVAHGPLLFADPLESVGSDDGQFAVTLDEYGLFWVSAGRFFASLALSPVSMVLEPPGTIMCSDGRLRRSRDTGESEPFDDERCIGTTTPTDVHEAWAFGETSTYEDGQASAAENGGGRYHARSRSSTASAGDGHPV